MEEQKDIVIQVDVKRTIEYQGSTFVEITGTVMDTEGLCKRPVAEVSSELAKVLTQLPRCTKLIIEVGQPVRFRRWESITQKEAPSEDIFHISQIEHIAELFGSPS